VGAANALVGFHLRLVVLQRGVAAFAWALAE